MDWIVNPTVLTQLSGAMQQRVEALTGIAGMPASWGDVDAEGNGLLSQESIDAWEAFLVDRGSTETVADVVLDATGQTLAALTVKPATDLDVKIVAFVREEVRGLSFLDIDYTRQLTMGRPQRLNIFGADPADRGTLTRIEWYESATPGDPPTYDNLLVAEDFLYTRTGNGLATERMQTVSWYRNDETIHPTTKERRKLYSKEEQVREASRRRSAPRRSR